MTKKLVDQPYIQYNNSNNERAKQNRKQMTKAEQRIWFEILQKRPLGYKFMRQKMIDSFILDFYCSKLLLCIEIDGDSHVGEENYDTMRSLKLGKLCVKVIRYTNQEVFDNIQGIYNNLLEEIRIRENNLERC